MKKPVVFIIFNRPDTTAIVFEEIRKYRPKQLFIIADGPRINKEKEEQLCEETKSVINVDWDCEVIQIYSKENLGCKKRISSGIDEVFKMVGEAIILEDDCLPHEDFFTYCEELLDYYKDNEQIIAISGNTFQPSSFEIEESYYFSLFPHCWGWATWKRAWDKMDIEMVNWPKYKESEEFDQICYDAFFKDYWTDIFNRTYSKQVDSWAYPWLFSSWYHNNLAILPKHNLVSNIGFRSDATHTIQSDALLDNLPTYPLPSPLNHPKFIIRNFEADFYTSENIFHLSKEKEKSFINEMKLNFFQYLLMEPLLNTLIEKDLYLFGTGTFALEIKKLLSLRGIRIKGFLQSNKVNASDSFRDGLIIYDLEELTQFQSGIVLVTIEGKHDVEIIEKIKSKNSYLEVYSWKKFIENL